MAVGVTVWSQTAANNATVDSAAQFAEGQAPSSLNDGIRGLMASVAMYRDDISGSLTTGGSSTAYTVSTNQGFASLAAMNARVFTIVPHTTCGDAPTLSVDSLTAKQIRTETGVSVASGVLVAGTPYEIVYFSSAGEFILMNFVANPYIVPIGVLLPYGGTSAPSSIFALCYGQAVSRTTYSILFGIFGTTYGVGDGTTTFNLPDLRGRVIAGKDNMGGSSADRLSGFAGSLNGDTMGATGGAETVTLSQAQLPNCNFTVSGISLSDPNHFHYEFNTDGGGSIPTTSGQQPTVSGNPGGDGSYSINGSGTAATIGKSSSASTGISVSSQGSAASGGSGGEHNNVQPTIILTYIVRLI